MGRIFVTSDLHFGHDRGFLYEPRGFNSPEEHDKGIIKNLNAHDNQFESECDVNWLEMMVLCLFANKHSTYKEGIRDTQVEAILSNYSNLGFFDAYLIEYENDKYDKLNLNQKLYMKNLVKIRLDIIIFVC